MFNYSLPYLLLLLHVPDLDAVVEKEPSAEGVREAHDAAADLATAHPALDVGRGALPEVPEHELPLCPHQDPRPVTVHVADGAVHPGHVALLLDNWEYQQLLQANNKAAPVNLAWSERRQR